MVSKPRRFVPCVLLAAGALSLTAGCGPIPVGTLAVSQRDGHLLIAVMRCDDTALERVAVTHRGPFQSDAPRTTIDDARWTTDLAGQDIVILDTAGPGDEWEVVDALEGPDPEVSYTASAGGDSDHPMGSVSFTTADLDALDEGQWLTAGGQKGEAAAVRPTTTDLDALRSESCNH